MGSTPEEVNRILEEVEDIPFPKSIAFQAPQHRVTLTKPYQFGIHEVTRGQFRQFITSTGYKTTAETDGLGGLGIRDRKQERSPEFLWNTNLGFDEDQTENDPVVNVSRFDAKAFCDWLSKKEGANYRLATEAEWEYACRAGSESRYCFGDEHNLLSNYSWYSESSKGIRTFAVGQKLPNSFGLYDMHGNVNEWCNSLLVDYTSAPEINPFVPPGTHAVIRGGCFDAPAQGVISAFRTSLSPAVHNTGFRVVKVMDAIKNTSDKSVDQPE